MPRKKNKRKVIQAAKRAAEKPKKLTDTTKSATNMKSRFGLAIVAAYLEDTHND